MNTTQKPKRSERRRQGARAAAIGVPSNDSAGAAKSEATAAVRMSTDRRFSMIGHTVKIVAPRSEWSELKGSYGTVENQWGDGSVCVKTTRPGRDGSTRICFAREEVETVPMNDTLRRADTEEYSLIIRSVALSQMTRWGGPDKQPLSDALKAAVVKRSERLAVQIRAIQRLDQQDLQRQARGMELGLSNWSTGLVLYTGGQH